MMKLLLDILLIILIFYVLECLYKYGYFKFEIDLRQHNNNKETEKETEKKDGTN